MKMGYDINHPIEIFAAKAEAGELGDNLPPGAPIEYIDLSETHPKYVLEKCDQWESFVENDLQPRTQHPPVTLRPVNSCAEEVRNDVS